MADVHDRAYIYLDSRFLGVLDRQANITQLPLTATAGQELMFVTESMGRVDFGPLLKDSKVTRVAAVAALKKTEITTFMTLGKKK